MNEDVFPDFRPPQFGYFQASTRIRYADGTIEERTDLPTLYPLWWFAELPEEPAASC